MSWGEWSTAPSLYFEHSFTYLGVGGTMFFFCLNINETAWAVFYCETKTTCYARGNNKALASG